jgi:hypothetical protein
MHQIIARILAVLLALQPWATGLALTRAKATSEASSLSNPNTGLGNKDQQQTAQARVVAQVLLVFTSDDAAPPSTTTYLEPKFQILNTSSFLQGAPQVSERLFARYEKWIE